MILPDINLLIYAHRTDSPNHAKALQALKAMAASVSPFALTSFVCTGFIRIVTNSRIFLEPSSLTEALAFIDSLASLPQCRFVEPSQLFWDLLKQTIAQTKSTANMVSDAYLAAVALENGCEIHTFDSDFLRFKSLKMVQL